MPCNRMHNLAYKNHGGYFGIHEARCPGYLMHRTYKPDQWTYARVFLMRTAAGHAIGSAHPDGHTY